MNDLNSLVRAVTAEAYELADKMGRLPERIEVAANFDMNNSGRLTLNQSRRFPGLIDVKGWNWLPRQRLQDFDS